MEYNLPVHECTSLSVSYVKSADSEFYERVREGGEYIDFSYNYIPSINPSESLISSVSGYSLIPVGKGVFGNGKQTFCF